MRQAHIRNDDFIIVAVKDDNEKLLHFVVADRNEELITDNKFEKASEAINWADRFYKGLIDE